MRSRRATRLAAVVSALFLAIGAPAAASAAELLEVVAGPGPEARRISLDRAALEAMPRSTLVTETPWTEGPTTFEGVLLRDLLASLDLPAGDVVARALNDYEATIPSADFLDHDVLIADRLDGAAMPVRDKGPLWIVYPLSQTPELRTPDSEAKMVWQLNRLTLSKQAGQ